MSPLTWDRGKELSDYAKFAFETGTKVLGWKTRQRCLRSSYSWFNNPVLHRPVELTQFRSQSFQLALRRHQLQGSMGRVGAAGDNAAMESFFSLLLKNVLDRKVWETREELRLAIVSWVEGK